MANELIFKHPSDGKFHVVSQTLLPTLVEAANGREGEPAVTEHYIQLSLAHPDTGITKLAKQLAEEEFHDSAFGGEYVPKTSVKETFLSADIAIDGTSMVVEKAVDEDGNNIFVADRAYLLMNRKAVPGESIHDTGLGADGALKPEAEVIFIGTAYTSGTTVTIVRSDPNAAARKRMAVLQSIPGVGASYGRTADSGVMIEFERPDVVTMGVQVDGTSQEITARFIKSLQQADTARAEGTYVGEHGVVTHYSVNVLKAAGPFKFAVRGLLEHCPPSQYDDTGQVDAVFEIDDAKLVTVDVDGTSHLEITGLNRYWDPADCALKAVDAGDYWVIVRAMNQAAFDSSLRISVPAPAKVTIA